VTRLDETSGGFRSARRGRVIEVILDRPPVNPIDFETWHGLERYLRALRDLDSVDVVVLAGANGHFSAGNDVKELVSADAAQLRRGTATVSRVLELVEEIPQVTIAALSGSVLGSGLMVAARCDLRIADPTASLGLPEVRAGTFGGYRIARSVLPSGEARLLALTGEAMTAERAYQIGAVQRLVAPGTALDEACRLAEQISAAAGRAVQRGAVRRARSGEILPVMQGHASEREDALRLLDGRRDANPPTTTSGGGVA
jgi:enoyl-CoA hydratase/carnithine racemase